MSSGFQAVCFDVGGVLIRITFRWADVAHRLGLDLPSSIQPEALLTDCDFFNSYQEGALTDDEYLSCLAAYLGGVGIETARSVHNAILVEPYPGVLELVTDLKANGLLTGCLSNTNEPHWMAMHSGEFPANEALDVGLASHRAGLQKPSEAIFREFERLAGCGPSEIVFFDDTAANCDAARRFGWHAVRIDPAGDPASQMRTELVRLKIL